MSAVATDMSKYSTAEIIKYQQETFDDPVGWSKRLFGVDLWSAQAKIFEALRDNKQVTVRSGNAIGKTKLAALATHWWLHSNYPSYVITTSSSWKGVEKVLWPEIRSLASSSNINLGPVPLNTEYRLADKWGAFGVSTNIPENFAGFHNPGGVLVIVDEGSGTEQDILDAIYGVTSDDASRILMIGNPLRPSGAFYKSFIVGDWKRIRVSSLDNPNVVEDRVVIPGLATRKWCDDRLKDWGKNSPAYQARVLGEFPSSDDDTVIGLALVEAALQSDLKPKDSDTVVIGVDVARFGDDLTVLQTVQGKYAHTPIKAASTTVTATAGMVIAEMRKWSDDKILNVNVDEIGIGAGVVDILHEQGYHKVRGINVAMPATDNVRYANLRAEGWYLTRDWLEAGGRLPRDEGLEGSLAAPRYKITSKGKIALEPKEQTKKRLKRSPDEADALVLALLPPPKERVLQIFL